MSWLLLSLVSLATIGVWVYTRSIGTDFGVFWRTAHEPISLVYTPHARYPFPYPPSAKMFLFFLAWVPKWPAFAAWTSLSALALWKAIRGTLGFWPSVMVMVSPPVTNGLATGQSTMFLAAAILFAFRIRHRVLAGMIFGAVATFKPQLVLFLPLLLVMRREWAAITAAALTAAVVIACTTALYGLESWVAWLGALPQFREALYTLKIVGAVITFPGFADRWGLPMLPFIVIGAIFGIILILRGAKEDFIDEAGLIAISSFFVAPYALTYDLILAAPYLAREIVRRNVVATFALAGAPNPMPIVLSAAALLGVRLEISDARARLRGSRTTK